MVGGSVLGGEGRGVAEGYAPYLGVGYCRHGGPLGENVLRGLRGDALACRGHPYMFLVLKSQQWLNLIIKTEKEKEKKEGKKNRNRKQHSDYE
jgi:hypothetical protein